MSNLYYCHLQVFGSNFQAEKFSHDINIENATIQSREKSYPRSAIEALILGNVNTWKTPKEYFKYDNDKIFDPFKGYLYEENFMINFLERFYDLQKILSPYRNETTEIYFSVVYKASFEEKPAGVYFGVELISALHRVGAAISTEVVFK